MTQHRRPRPHVLAPQSGALAIRYVLVDGRTTEELLPTRYSIAAATKEARNACMLSAYRAATLGVLGEDGFSPLVRFRADGDGVRRVS